MPARILNRRSLQFRVDKVIYAKLKVIAEKEFRTINTQIEYCCKQYVEDYERKYGEIDIKPDDE